MWCAVTQWETLWGWGVLALGPLPSPAQLCISVGGSCGLFPRLPSQRVQFLGGRECWGQEEGEAGVFLPCLSASGSVSSSHGIAPGLRVLLARPAGVSAFSSIAPEGAGGFPQLLILVLGFLALPSSASPSASIKIPPSC